MIARVWKGTAKGDDAADYVAHLRDSVFPEIATIDGHEGAYVLQRDLNGTVEFTVITLWASMEAIHRFAGPDAEAAVVAPRARALLARYDDRVTHYEVPLSVR
jgi:heme-degrading monooxygenase HmoA